MMNVFAHIVLIAFIGTLPLRHLGKPLEFFIDPTVLANDDNKIERWYVGAGTVKVVEWNESHVPTTLVKEEEYVRPASGALVVGCIVAIACVINHRTNTPVYPDTVTVFVAALATALVEVFGPRPLR